MNINWQQISLSETQTIKEALEVLDKGALRIALVVSPDDTLKGVVTDGDIRRGLLKGVGLERPVLDVMTITPRTVSPEQSFSEVKELMENLDLLAIPVVNDECKVVDLHILKESFFYPEVENPVFIMAGGFGTRLRPLTDNCPKPMLNVGGRPMLETIIRQFKKQGFKNFFLSTHYLPEVIHNHFGDGASFGVNIQYVHEDTPLGTGGALGLLPELTPKLPLVVINGDVLTKIDFSKLLEFHNLGAACATMCVREYEYQVPYGVINGEGQKIESMVEKPIQRFFINAGVYVLSPEVFNSINAGTKVDMPTVLEHQIASGKLVHKYPVHEYWLDMGQIQDFERAQVDIKVLDI